MIKWQSPSPYTAPSTWSTVTNFSANVIPGMTPLKILTVASKVYDYYQAMVALEEGKKALENCIEELNLAMNEYQQQIDAASEAGLLNNYIQPLQKQLMLTEQKQRQMIEQLYLMTNAIKKGQLRISSLEQMAKSIL